MVRETVQWKLSHMVGQTEDTTVLTKCHNLVNSNDPNIPFLCMKGELMKKSQEGRLEKKGEPRMTQCASTNQKKKKKSKIPTEFVH